MKKIEDSKQADMDVANSSRTRTHLKDPVHDKPTIIVPDDGCEQATSREDILRLIDKIRNG